MPRVLSAAQLTTVLLLVGGTIIGCATIVSGPKATVALHSEPPGAQVTVRNPEGTVVAQTTTPGEVSLKRSSKWAKPASYVARFEMPGYTPAETPIRTKFNPWTIGNIILGGPLGLAVDATTGAIYRPQHDEIAPVLAWAGVPTEPSQVRTASATDPQQPAPQRGVVR